MVPTGVSQVIEALSKMVLGLILAAVIHYSAIEPPELRERLSRVSEAEFQHVCGDCRWQEMGLCSYALLKERTMP